MGLLSKLFGGGRKQEPNEPPTAFPLNFTGPGVHQKQLSSKWGVVFEDDGETGYLYATDAAHSVALDALHLYNRSDPDPLKQGEPAFIVWNPRVARVGLFYRDQFQAVFDFDAKRGSCRTGFPGPIGEHGWSRRGHAWDQSMISGLEP
jgi:hypothetical protein